jgi:hypothetical protein
LGKNKKEFRALHGLLSCVAKKVTKEGHPVGLSSALCAADTQSGRAFPEGTSMYRPETSRIVRAALRVFAPPACQASTGSKIKIEGACGHSIPHRNPDGLKIMPRTQNPKTQ